jgi:hypothetical protein
MNIEDLNFPEQKKPFAGTCHHRWLNQESPYVVAQVCEVCKLYRYKSSATADWEYRAPIPVGRSLAAE